MQTLIPANINEITVCVTVAVTREMLVNSFPSALYYQYLYICIGRPSHILYPLS